MVELADYQLEAIEKLGTGSILNGGVGSGKSRTALAYYMLKVCEGEVKINGHGQNRPMKFPRDLYIITTPKKRDSLEWDRECSDFLLSQNENVHGVKVVIDSWNNIKKYTKVYGAFFIFDEQRVVGKGAWVRSFLNIARKNSWILLSATPGDQWSDYIPVFVANGFYKNRTEFQNAHCVWSRYSTFPKIERYVGTKILEKYRDKITVKMNNVSPNQRNYFDLICDYDHEMYKTVVAKRWDPYDDVPIEECSKWYYLQRKVVNSDKDRIYKLNEILEMHKKLIVFYNFDYELDLLRRNALQNDIAYGEWNGHVHLMIPSCYDKWMYFVQYNAGSEGWNCIDTDTLVFFSQNYSYRMTEQAAGRIDRMNQTNNTLYYYRLLSKSPIDLAIRRRLNDKKNFNEDTRKWQNLDSREKHAPL